MAHKMALVYQAQEELLATSKICWVTKSVLPTNTSVMMSVGRNAEIQGGHWISWRPKNVKLMKEHAEWT